MIKTSTSNLLLLHAYGETTELQKQELSALMAAQPELVNESMDLVRTKRKLNQKLLSPSTTSIRIIMEHSYKTAQLQEI